MCCRWRLGIEKPSIGEGPVRSPQSPGGQEAASMELVALLVPHSLDTVTYAPWVVGQTSEGRVWGGRGEVSRAGKMSCAGQRHSSAHRKIPRRTAKFFGVPRIRRGPRRSSADASLKGTTRMALIRRKRALDKRCPAQDILPTRLTSPFGYLRVAVMARNRRRKLRRADCAGPDAAEKHWWHSASLQAPRHASDELP